VKLYRFGRPSLFLGQATLGCCPGGREYYVGFEPALLTAPKIEKEHPKGSFVLFKIGLGRYVLRYLPPFSDRGDLGSLVVNEENQEYSDELLGLANVNGISIEADQENRPYIKVFVSKLTEEVRKNALVHNRAVIEKKWKKVKIIAIPEM